MVGDNVKDIDWKASARSDKIIIKQYIAEKKHNILFILDSGKKMMADTQELDSKKEIALMTLGTVGYLIYKHGDSIGAIYQGNENAKFIPFQTGLYHLEKMITSYEKTISNETSLEELINYSIKCIRKKMIVCIITDLDGMSNISEDTLRKISYSNDVIFINISDAFLTNLHSFDIDKEKYTSSFFLEDDKLKELEYSLKTKLYEETKERLKKYQIMTTTINKEEEIVNDVLRLLERRKHANIR